MKRKNQMYDKINVYICALFIILLSISFNFFAHDEEASFNGTQ